jgi:hypothetical protein
VKKQHTFFKKVKNSTPSSKKPRKFIRNFFFSFFSFLPHIFPFNQKYPVQTSVVLSIIMAAPLHLFPQSTEYKLAG